MILNQEGKTYSFSYTGGEQIADIPYPCILKFRCWGGNGGADSARGGFGGYAEGRFKLIKWNTKLYIYVGGNGRSSCSGTGGGYNGGGNAGRSGTSGAGGGATHVALVPGLLSTLESQKQNILIVAAGAGGGGNSYGSKIGRNGGGLTGQGGDGCAGGSQTAGGSGGAAGSFGRGGHRSGGNNDGGGGGAGFYGGGASNGDGGGAGGSSYIKPLYDAKTIMSTATVTPKCEIILEKFICKFLVKTPEGVFKYKNGIFVGI